MASASLLDTEAAAASSDTAAFLYPVALNVRGRRCVVVGGGAVGARKARALSDAGADVLVIAPEAGDAVAAMAADGRVAYRSEPFSPDYLEGAFLVIAATDRPDVNQAVADAARAHGVLLNRAADGEGTDTGDFATMAAVRRGDLLLSVTTGGAGPALATRLRQWLEEQIGPEWEPYVDLLGAVRAVAKREIADPEARARALRRLAADESVREMIAAGNTAGAWEEAIACLSE